MQVICEHDMVNVKKKMTEIRRNRKGRAIRQNYYGNCDQNEEIFVVYGTDTVVLWEYDHDVIRGYFYSSDEGELSELLQYLPNGCIVDYLTRTKGDMQEFLETHGFQLLHEMHRMSSVGMTEEEKAAIAKNYAIIKEALYEPQHVRLADINDLEVVYKKLYEVFDVKESHLPNRDELMDLIKKKWVILYQIQGQLLGIYIITINNGQAYGYQIWNGTGPEGYFSLLEYSSQLYAEYMKNESNTSKQSKPGYCWVDVSNRKAVRIVKLWGSKFDGLYDFVYEKQ